MSIVAARNSVLDFIRVLQAQALHDLAQLVLQQIEALDTTAVSIRRDRQTGPRHSDPPTHLSVQLAVLVEIHGVEGSTEANQFCFGQLLIDDLQRGPLELVHVDESLQRALAVVHRVGHTTLLRNSEPGMLQRLSGRGSLGGIDSQTGADEVLGLQRDVVPIRRGEVELERQRSPHRYLQSSMRFPQRGEKEDDGLRVV
jgi:hypothetical protein